MTDDKTENTDDSVIKTALDRFKCLEDLNDENYKRGEEDVEFVLGDQWPEQIKNERLSQGRPCLTENRLLPFVHQVVNQIRQARPAIRPKPVDDAADVETADILAGIIRNIETVSDAESVYDRAAYNAVSAGIGWIRIVTDYADQDSFEQEIRIEEVMNPFSVYLDPDGEYGFVFDDMDKDDFEAAYPNAKAEGFELNDKHASWLQDDKVRIAEYYYKDYETKTLVEWSGGIQMENVISYSEDVPEGAEIIQERTVEIPKIKYCKLTAAEVLEETEVLGNFIPLVPVKGFETWADGKCQLYSLIHQAKDPQMMFNFWKTASTEVIALQPKAPFIGAKGQFKSNPRAWQNANRENYPFLEYDMVIDPKSGVPAPPPQRQAPPSSTGAQLQEAMAAADGIKASLGMYDASLGNQTNDISGKAIIARQMEGDNATFHFIDNLSTAMKKVGRILIDLIPKVYTERRILRILGEDGTEEMVPINQPYAKNENGDRVPLGQGMQMAGVFDLKAGKYDVVVEVGPAYATKRQEAANALIEIARVRPELLDVAGDILIKSLDVPHAQELADRIRATMDPALLGEDLEAKRLQMMTQGMQQLEQRLAETQAALDAKKNNQAFENQLEAKKLELEAQKTQADIAKTMADIEKIKTETQAQIPAEVMQDLASAITDLNARTIDIEGAFDAFLSAQEMEGATGEPV